LLESKRCPQSYEPICIESCSLWAKEKEKGQMQNDSIGAFSSKAQETFITLVKE
jgi:hypothetical protein